MNLTRRDLLKVGLAASGSLMLPEGLFPSQALADVGDSTVYFTTPTILEPIFSEEVDSSAGTRIRDVYLIEMQKFNKVLVPGTNPVEIWGYNGEFPGPTIRQMLDRESVVLFVNKLGQDKDGQDINTVVHLHGMASLPQYDGYAEDIIPPNYFKEYHYPNDRAATIWYHDHTVHKTRRNVAQGLLGMYIVQDKLELDLNLPSGDYDVPIIIHEHASFSGYDLVNGAYQPVMEVARRKYRFRILSAFANNVDNLQLNPDLNEGLTVIGTDSGLRTSPVKVRTLPMVSGERYEIIIDFSKYAKGQKIILETVKYDSQNKPMDTRTLMTFAVTREEQDDSNLPPRLRQFNPIPIYAAKQIRTFKFALDGPDKNPRCPDFPNLDTSWAINGKDWDKTQVVAKPVLGDIEIWRLENKSDRIHPIHIHLIDMHLIWRNGELPKSSDYDYGWKDVFLLKPFETLMIIGKFGTHKGKYLMHCHNLFHEDCDMMAQFEVCEEKVIEDEKGKKSTIIVCDALDPSTIAPAQPCPPELEALLRVYEEIRGLQGHLRKYDRHLREYEGHKREVEGTLRKIEEVEGTLKRLKVLSPKKGSRGNSKENRGSRGNSEIEGLTSKSFKR